MSSCLGDGSVCVESKRTSKGCEKPLLRDLDAIETVDLNKMLSPILSPPETIKQWPRKGPLPQGMLLEPLHKQMYWSTNAQLSELRQKEYFNVINPTHKLTNARCHLSSYGHPDIAIKGNFGKGVLENTTPLNLSHIVDIIDPQDGDTAMLFFSEAVEKQMRINGDYIEE